MLGAAPRCVGLLHLTAAVKAKVLTTLRPQENPGWNGDDWELLRHVSGRIYLDFVGEVRDSCASLFQVSFVDCPGHDILMATMLNGAAVWFLVVSVYPYA